MNNNNEQREPSNGWPETDAERAQRAAFEAWAKNRWGACAYLHTGPTSGEWDAWKSASATVPPVRVMTPVAAYSCAKRAADPSNESAACKRWCGNEKTCLHTGAADLTLAETMVRFYEAATPEMQAYLRGEGPKPA